MKKLSTIIALTAGLAMTTIAHAQTVLKMGSVAPTTSPWGKWATAVAAKIEEQTGGELKIDLLLDAQAGDEQTILRQTTRGRMDIAYVSNVPLTLLAPEIGLAAAPYIFDSIDQGTCVAHNHLTGTFGDLMTNAGVFPLTWMEVGNYNIFSTEPLKTPDGLKGKKVRVAATAVDEAFARALGTSGVPLGTSDTVPALQTGNVNAAFIATVFGIATGIHKVAPHIVVTKHPRLIGSVSVSKGTWDTLSAEHRAVLKGAFEAAGPQLTEIILGAEKALLGKVTEAGLPVYTPTEEELAAWRAAGTPVAAEMAAKMGDTGKAVLEAINKAKAACNG